MEGRKEARKERKKDRKEGKKERRKKSTSKLANEKQKKNKNKRTHKRPKTNKERTTSDPRIIKKRSQTTKLEPDLVENGPQNGAKRAKMDQKRSQDEQKIDADRARWPKTAPDSAKEPPRRPNQGYGGKLGLQNGSPNRPKSMKKIINFFSLIFSPILVDFGSHFGPPALRHSPFWASWAAPWRYLALSWAILRDLLRFFTPLGSIFDPCCSS